MNRLETIEACHLLPAGDPPIVGWHGAGVHHGRGDHTCPAHGSGQCVDTFHAQSALAGLSEADLLALWRSWRKAARP